MPPLKYNIPADLGVKSKEGRVGGGAGVSRDMMLQSSPPEAVIFSREMIGCNSDTAPVPTEVGSPKDLPTCTFKQSFPPVEQEQ